MRIVTHIALAAVAAGALALGTAAIAEEAKKPEAKPQAGEHRQHGKNREMRGDCSGEARGASRGEHEHREHGRMGHDRS
jgi:Spy/CpxP family protein refolding chaperone